MTDIESKVKDVYDLFFKQLNIDPQTGEIPNRDKKFATYPHIGSKYGEPNHPKLLFVSLDIGEDVREGRIQSFKERRHRYEVKVVNHPSPHSTGTYIRALYYLRQEDPECTEYWKQLDSQKLDDQKTCQQLLKEKDKLPSKNPLSYITLTNCHKFVTCGRKNKTGGKDRVFIDKEKESELLVDEVEAFDPDIIVLQSTRFSKEPYRKTFNKIALERELYIGPNPSTREKGKYIHVRKPRTLIGWYSDWPVRPIPR